MASSDVDHVEGKENGSADTVTEPIEHTETLHLPTYRDLTELNAHAPDRQSAIRIWIPEPWGAVIVPYLALLGVLHQDQVAADRAPLRVQDGLAVGGKLTDETSCCSVRLVQETRVGSPL